MIHIRFKVVKIECPNCKKQAQAVHIIDNHFSNKNGRVKTEGFQCFNCRIFKELKLKT